MDSDDSVNDLLGDECIEEGVSNDASMAKKDETVDRLMKEQLERAKKKKLEFEEKQEEKRRALEREAKMHELEQQIKNLNNEEEVDRLRKKQKEETEKEKLQFEKKQEDERHALEKEAKKHQFEQEMEKLTNEKELDRLKKVLREDKEVETRSTEDKNEKMEVEKGMKEVLKKMKEMKNELNELKEIKKELYELKQEMKEMKEKEKSRQVDEERAKVQEETIRLREREAEQRARNEETTRSKREQEITERREREEREAEKKRKTMESRPNEEQTPALRKESNDPGTFIMKFKQTILDDDIAANKSGKTDRVRTEKNLVPPVPQVDNFSRNSGLEVEEERVAEERCPPKKKETAEEQELQMKGKKEGNGAVEKRKREELQQKEDQDRLAREKNLEAETAKEQNEFGTSGEVATANEGNKNQSINNTDEMESQEAQKDLEPGNEKIVELEDDDDDVIISKALSPNSPREGVVDFTDPYESDLEDLDETDNAETDEVEEEMPVPTSPPAIRSSGIIADSEELQKESNTSPKKARKRGRPRLTYIDSSEEQTITRTQDQIDEKWPESDVILHQNFGKDTLTEAFNRFVLFAISELYPDLPEENVRLMKVHEYIKNRMPEMNHFHVPVDIDKVYTEKEWEDYRKLGEYFRACISEEIIELEKIPDIPSTVQFKTPALCFTGKRHVPLTATFDEVEQRSIRSVKARKNFIFTEEELQKRPISDVAKREKEMLLKEAGMQMVESKYHPTPVYDCKKDELHGEKVKRMMFCSSMMMFKNFENATETNGQLFSAETIGNISADEKIDVAHQPPQPANTNRNIYGASNWRYASRIGEMPLRQHLEYIRKMKDHGLKILDEMMASVELEKSDEENVAALKATEERLTKSLKDVELLANIDWMDYDSVLFWVNFGTNIDINNPKKYKEQQEEFKKWPKYIQPFNVEENLLSSLKEDILGVNTVQIYSKSFGVRTAAHKENCSFGSVNVNRGGADCTWYAIPEEYSNLTEELVQKKSVQHGEVQFYGQNFWPCEEEVLKAGIPLQKALQKPGDAVVVMPGTLHWVQSEGFCDNYAYNFCPPSEIQLRMALVTTTEYRNKKNGQAPLCKMIWDIAEEGRFRDNKPIYDLVRDVLIRSLGHFIMHREALLQQNPSVKIKMKDPPAVTFRCSECQVEIFNLVCTRGIKNITAFCWQCSTKTRGRKRYQQHYSMEWLKAMSESAVLKNGQLPITGLEKATPWQLYIYHHKMAQAEKLAEKLVIRELNAMEYKGIETRILNLKSSAIDALKEETPSVSDLTQEIAAVGPRTNDFFETKYSLENMQDYYDRYADANRIYADYWECADQRKKQQLLQQYHEAKREAVGCLMTGKELELIHLNFRPRTKEPEAVNGNNNQNGEKSGNGPENGFGDESAGSVPKEKLRELGLLLKRGIPRDMASPEMSCYRGRPTIMSSVKASTSSVDTFVGEFRPKYPPLYFRIPEHFTPAQRYHFRQMFNVPNPAIKEEKVEVKKEEEQKDQKDRKDQKKIEPKAEPLPEDCVQVTFKSLSISFSNTPGNGKMVDLVE
ncbi:unnamed protein product [Caenorhabditis sp. 36 PRJEB53466]|nr:unnamed protein product [Caenorhabditis sp. 36 PRJEB53466]